MPSVRRDTASLLTDILADASSAGNSALDVHACWLLFRGGASDADVEGQHHPEVKKQRGASGMGSNKFIPGISRDQKKQGKGVT